MTKNFFKEKKVGIVGYGFVGKATHKGILKDIEIKIHDVSMDTSLEDLFDIDIAFYCIPTDDDLHIQTLLTEIQQLKKINKTCKIVVRSTVPLGTCKKIQELIQDTIVYIPEFLRQRSWKDDCMRRPLIVGHSGDLNKEWFNQNDIIECSLEEAEIVKMFNNNFAALKVVFANHFYMLAKSSNSNYDLIVDMFTKVSHDQSYLEVNENLRGFGGKCLPKDLDFIINTFKNLNLSQTLFDSVKKDNTQWKETVRKF